MNDLSLPLALICGLIWAAALARAAIPAFVRFTVDFAVCVLRSVAEWQWKEAWCLVRLWWLFFKRTPAERAKMAAMLTEYHR